MNVLSDVDIKPQDGDPLAVAIGEDEIHLLYQAMRDDVTGIERVGLFYAHGTISQTPFSFQAPAGDDAQMPELLVLEDDDEDVLVAAWIEGDGRTSEIVSVVQDSVWSVEEYTITPSGATKVVMIEMGEDRIKVFHDEVGISDPLQGMDCSTWVIPKFTFKHNWWWARHWRVQSAKMRLSSGITIRTNKWKDHCNHQP